MTRGRRGSLALRRMTLPFTTTLPVFAGAPGVTYADRKLTGTFAVALVLVLTATGLWAGGADEEGAAAAADKKYVTDPTTGKVVTAPEYGRTITYASSFDPPSADNWFSHHTGHGNSGVVEKLAIVDRGVDRSV